MKIAIFHEYFVYFLAPWGVKELSNAYQDLQQQS